ncbi:MAG: signal recognition particle-docking protein FtsY, partial [Acidimicrobiales bacterium]
PKPMRRGPPRSPVRPEARAGPAPPTGAPPEAGDDLAARVEEAFAPPEEREAPGPTPEPVGEAPIEEAPAPEAPAPEAPAPEAPVEEAPVEEAPPRPRFRDRMGKARAALAVRLSSVASREKIDAETWDELEEALVLADVGVALTTSLLDALRARVRSGEIKSAEALLDGLKADLKAAMAQGDRRLHLEPGPANVWLFVGVNGVGKTTTIGKVGMREAEAGRTVVMAAGDTFRAAAAEQLELWAHRVGADLIRGAEGGDPGSVVFDAVQRAAARQADLVLADTAGRLHTKVNLMEELRKVRRVAERPPGRLVEVLLVVDATTGQNGLVQARQFTEAVGVTGIVLTKLDGTAKGGIVLAIQSELGLPIKLVGLGETAADLVEFDPDEFVDALFD